MLRLLRPVVTVIALSVLLVACEKNQAPVELTPTIVIAPFQAIGNAESGQYGLGLLNFSNVVASEMGAVSDWTILESSRQDMLLEEFNVFTSLAPEPSTEIPQDQLSSFTAAYPSADYMVLGQLNGFDVSPVRESNGGVLSRRLNRIRTSVDIRIASVATREWLVARTVQIDAAFADDAFAETQINAAMQAAAKEVVSNILLATTGDATVVEEGQQQDERVVSISAGRQQGVQPGMQFEVYGERAIDGNSVIEIISTQAANALAKVISGNPTVTSRVELKPLSNTRADQQAGGPIRIAIGGFQSLELSKQQKINLDPVASYLRLQLPAKLANYGGVKVVEQSDGIKEALLSQQFLDDLSKGREPGLPQGSLRGVDYLVFGYFTDLDFTQAKTSWEFDFGTAIRTDSDAKAEVNFLINMIDVNSGEYAFSQTISTQFDIIENQRSEVIADLSNRFSQKLFEELMLSVRPLSVINASSDTVTLNHKADVGLDVGDQFQAQGVGGSVVDRYTGDMLEGVGGEYFGVVEISGFDAGGWALATVVDGQLPALGAVLSPIKEASEDEPKTKKRKLNW